MYHPFTIAETIRTAWDVLKKNFVTIIVYSTITWIVFMLINFFNDYINTEQDFLTTVIIFIVLMFIQAYTTLGLYKLIFTLIDSEYYEFELSQVIPGFKMVTSFISISLITAFVFVSIDLLVRFLLRSQQIALSIAETVELIVLLYLLLRFIFCICYIVDDNSGPIESLQQSFALTKQYIGKIIVIMLISIVLIAIGFALKKIGVILTYPLVNIMLIVAYRRLVYSHKDVDDDIVAETI